MRKFIFELLYKLRLDFSCKHSRKVAFRVSNKIGRLAKLTTQSMAQKWPRDKSEVGLKRPRKRCC
jgi:hypothetical protein